MADHRLAAAWLLAIATAMLLVASMTSAGTGPWGFALLGHMAWSYTLLIVVFVFVLLLARPDEAGA